MVLGVSLSRQQRLLHGTAPGAGSTVSLRLVSRRAPRPFVPPPIKQDVVPGRAIDLDITHTGVTTSRMLSSAAWHAANQVDVVESAEDHRCGSSRPPVSRAAGSGVAVDEFAIRQIKANPSWATVPPAPPLR